MQGLKLFLLSLVSMNVIIKMRVETYRNLCANRLPIAIGRRALWRWRALLSLSKEEVEKRDNKSSSRERYWMFWYSVPVALLFNKKSRTVYLKQWKPYNLKRRRNSIIYGNFINKYSRKFTHPFEEAAFNTFFFSQFFIFFIIFHTLRSFSLH